MKTIGKRIGVDFGKDNDTEVYDFLIKKGYARLAALLLNDPEPKPKKRKLQIIKITKPERKRSCRHSWKIERRLRWCMCAGSHCDVEGSQPGSVFVCLKCLKRKTKYD